MSYRFIITYIQHIYGTAITYTYYYYQRIPLNTLTPSLLVQQLMRYYSILTTTWMLLMELLSHGGRGREAETLPRPRLL